MSGRLEGDCHQVFIRVLSVSTDWSVSGHRGHCARIVTFATHAFLSSTRFVSTLIACYPENYNFDGENELSRPSECSTRINSECFASFRTFSSCEVKKTFVMVLNTDKFY